MSEMRAAQRTDMLEHKLTKFGARKPTFQIQSSRTCRVQSPVLLINQITSFDRSLTVVVVPVSDGDPDPQPDPDPHVFGPP